MDKKFIVKFVGYWIVNTIVLSLANTFFPDALEMGNEYLSLPMSAVISGFLLTALLLLAKGLAKTRNVQTKGRYIMFLYYSFSASLAIWLIARLASLSGFGIVKYTWAIGAGVAVAFFNWLLRRVFKGLKMA